MKRSKKNKTNGAASTPRNPNVPADAVLRKRYTEKLPCRVDDVEVAAAAIALAKIVREQENLDEARRKVLAGFREQQSSIKDRQKELATTVEQHTVARSVPCTDYLLTDKRIMTVRDDTGEVVMTREGKAGEQEPIRGIDESKSTDDDGIVEDDEIPADAVKGPQPDSPDARPSDGA